MIDRREFLRLYFRFIAHAICFALLSIPIRFFASCARLNNRFLAKIAGTGRIRQFYRVCKRSIRLIKIWQKLDWFRDGLGDKIDYKLERLDHLYYVLYGKHFV